MKKNNKQRHAEPKTGAGNLFDKGIRNVPTDLNSRPNTEKEQVSKTLTIEWTKPTRESKNIAGFAYSESEATLALKFNSGKVYTYTQVPNDLFLTMLGVDKTQESLGSWVIKNITSKPTQFPHKAEN